MSKLHSNFLDLGELRLPQFQNRQVYMQTFDTNCVRLSGLEDYTEIVQQLCTEADYSGEAHLTVDEKIISAGWSQRRPGAHVDGRFNGTYWSHPSPGWLHYCNFVPIERMSVIIASSVPGCLAYPGEFEGKPKIDGDLEHIRKQFHTGELLPANRGFLLSPDCVHESIRFNAPTQRIFMRIALGKIESAAR